MNLEEIKKLNGRIRETLRAEEAELLKYFIMQGRKYNIEIMITKELSEDQVHEIGEMDQSETERMIHQANSRIIVRHHEQQTPGPSVMIYCIWSNEHKKWWKPNGVSYTPNIEEAGQFSETATKKILASANINTPTAGIIEEYAIPVELSVTTNNNRPPEPETRPRSQEVPAAGYRRSGGPEGDA